MQPSMFYPKKPCEIGVLPTVALHGLCEGSVSGMLARGIVLQGYRSREYIKDAGIPARLDRVRAEHAEGHIQSRAWHTPVPAVFLDRDGTLNFDRHWINSPEQVELLPGAAEAVRAINESGWLAVVITNQPVIARGECTEAQLAQIHNRLEWLLASRMLSWMRSTIVRTTPKKDLTVNARI